MDSLLEQLLAYSKDSYYPMHMPGHKRNTVLLKGFDPYDIDITEIDGFDNLHHAEGIIKGLAERVQMLYHSKKSYLLINGSTVGILAGISACVKKNDRIVMARNCHKAVYNAVILNELKPVYVYPQMDGVYGIAGGISAKKIEELLITYPDTKLVVLTSPTYEGMISDVKEIVRICHAHQVPVLVDEAHGAHLGFHKDFPENSIAAGADLVIHSIHKTLPALTQTAVMHVNGTRINEKEVEKYLGIYETSSPSYVLMAGIDQCITLLLEQSQELFEEYRKRLRLFYEEVQGLRHLQVMKASDYITENQQEHQIYGIDPSKILISVKNTTITGSELSRRLLKEYKIQLEMSSLSYALAMTSICDTEEGFDRLRDALYEIDASLTSSKMRTMDLEIIKLKQACTPYESLQKKNEVINLNYAAGRVAANSVMVYPPGIPIVAAGEIINEQVIGTIREAFDAGLELLGLEVEPDPSSREKSELCVTVLREEECYNTTIKET